MRKLTAILLMVAGMTMTATSASAAKYQFEGTLGIERATTACSILPYVEQGNLYRAVYRPAGLGNNGDSTALYVAAGDITGDDHVGIIAILIALVIDSGSLTPTLRTAQASEAKPTEALALNFMQYTVGMRLLEQTPATLTEDTKLLTMRLVIRNFGNVSQCTVMLRAVMRVDNATPLISP